MDRCVGMRRLWRRETMMADEKNVEERKPFISFSFTEEGVFDRYAGIYLHLPLEKPPTGEEIAIMVGTIKTYAKCWHQLSGKLGLAQPPPDGPHEASKPKPASKPDSTPHCQATGVWAAAKGRYKEGFRADWKHNDPRVNKNGELYCPTPIDQDADGKLIWCGWRATEGENGWEEWDLNAKEDSLPFD